MENEFSVSIVGTGITAVKAIDIITNRDNNIFRYYLVNNRPDSSKSLPLHKPYMSFKEKGADSNNTVYFNHIEEIRDIIDKITDVSTVILALALGDGSAHEMTKYLSECSRQNKALTICMAAMPFDFEDYIKTKQAQQELTALENYTDLVITVDFAASIPPECCMSDMVTYNESLRYFSNTIESVITMLRTDIICGIDFKEFKAIIEEGTRANACNRIINRADLYESDIWYKLPYDRDMISRLNAGTVLLNITGGYELTNSDVKTILFRINRLIAKGKLKFSILPDGSYEERIRIGLIFIEN